MTNQLIIENTAVRIDSEGRFNINDLHKASGGENRKRPSLWASNQQTQDLIDEVKAGIPASEPIVSTRGGTGSTTFVVKELVYAYAMWISPKFHLHVIRAYDQYQAGNVQPAQPQVPQSFAEALRLAADTHEKYEQAKLEKQVAEDKADRYETVIGTHRHSLGQFGRTITGLNTQKLKSDLMDLGYLYRRGGGYRRYAYFSHLFEEQHHEEYGSREIYPTTKGKELILELYEQGRLTLKKAYQM